MQIINRLWLYYTNYKRNNWIIDPKIDYKQECILYQWIITNLISLAPHLNWIIPLQQSKMLIGSLINSSLWIQLIWHNIIQSKINSWISVEHHLILLIRERGNKVKQKQHQIFKWMKRRIIRIVMWMLQIIIPIIIKLILISIMWTSIVWIEEIELIIQIKTTLIKK